LVAVEILGKPKCDKRRVPALTGRSCGVSGSVWMARGRLRPAETDWLNVIPQGGMQPLLETLFHA
jgi:hypothetical protein